MINKIIKKLKPSRNQEENRVKENKSEEPKPEVNNSTTHAPNIYCISYEAGKSHTVAYKTGDLGDDIEIAGESDIGASRNSNEDRIGIFAGNSKALVVLADGMGGHNAGEVASDLAVIELRKQLSKFVLNSRIIPGDSMNAKEYAAEYIKNSINDSIKKTNTIIKEYAGINSDYAGMGTALVAALLIKHDLYVGWVGDSRLYVVNENEILRITKDHSAVQQMVDNGVITMDEAMHHPMKNQILQAVGYASEVSPDTIRKTVYSDDYILLSSDGLHDVVTDKKIREIIMRCGFDLKKACRELVNAANNKGGPDNISVIIIKLPGNLSSKNDIINEKTRIMNL